MKASLFLLFSILLFCTFAQGQIRYRTNGNATISGTSVTSGTLTKVSDNTTVTSFTVNDTIEIIHTLTISSATTVRALVYNGGTTSTANSVNITVSYVTGTGSLTSGTGASRVLLANGGTLENATLTGSGAIGMVSGNNNNVNFKGTINLSMAFAQNVGLAGGTDLHTVTLLAGANISLPGFIGTGTGKTIIGNSTANLTITGNTNRLIFNQNTDGVTNVVNNFTLNSGSGNMLLDANMRVGGLLTLTSGTLNLNGFALTISGSSPVISSGFINPNGGSMVFANTSPIVLPSGLLSVYSFHNCTINGSGGVTLGNHTTVSNALTLTSGVLTTGAFTLTIAGTLTYSSGAINASNAAASVVFNNTSSINIANNCFSGTPNKITMNGAGGLNLVGNLTIADSLLLTIDTLTVNGFTLSVVGRKIKTDNGVIDATNAGATILFTDIAIANGGLGEATIVITTFVNGTIANLATNNTGGVVMGSNLIISNGLALNTGSLTVGSYILTYSGGTPTLSNGAKVNTVVGKVVLLHTSNISLPSDFFTGGVRFLELNGTGNVTINNQLNIIDSADFINGTLVVNGYTLTLGNIASALDFYIAKTNGFIDATATNSRITFANTYLAGNIALPANIFTNETIYDFFVNHSGGVSLASNLTITNQLNVQWGYLSIGSTTLTIAGLTPTVSNTGRVVATNANSKVVFTNSTPITVSSQFFNNAVAAKLTINSTSTVSLDSIVNISGILELQAGTLVNSNRLVLTNGASIYRSNGSFDAAPVFGTQATDRINLFINGTCTSSFELQGSMGAIGQLTVLTSGNTYSLASGVNPTVYAGITIGSNSVLIGGSNTITLAGGNWNNYGTFTNTNSTVVFTGNNQTIYRTTTVPATFNNLTIAASNTVTLLSGLSVTGQLTLTSGTLTLGVYNLTLGRAPTRTSGTIDASNTAATVTFTNVSVAAGGIGPVTIGNGVFNNNSIANLATTNSGGLVMGANLTINNSLSLSFGSLTVGANVLTINTNNLTVANAATVIALDANATVVFGNTSPLSLPNLFFNGNAPTNLTINGTGGVTPIGNLIVNGTMSLLSGTFTIATDKFLRLKQTPTRTAGFIHASNSGAIVSFDNSSLITLPANLFVSNTINYFATIAGASGGVQMGGDLSITTKLELNTGSLTVGANTLTLSNTVPTVANAAQLIATNLSSVVVFANSTTWNMPSTFFSANTVGNIVLNGTGGVVLWANLTITNNTTLTNGTLNVNGNTLQLAKAPTRTSGTINASGHSASTIVFANSSIADGGIGPVTIASNVFSSNTISRLQTNNSGGVVLSTDLTVANSLALSFGYLNINTNTLSINTATISVANGANVIASNTNAQVVWGNTASATLPSSFFSNNIVNRLTLNGTGGIVLSANVEVSGTLTLTTGIITTGSNVLSVTATNTAAISGGSSSAYVSGSLKRFLPTNLSSGTTYSFPIGKSGSYLPLGLVNPTTTTGTIAVQADAFVSATGGSRNATIFANSNAEYWQLTTSGNFVNASLTLSRTASISPLNVIAGSATLTGTYTSLSGTANSTGVSASNAIGSNRFFVLAQAPVIVVSSISPTSLSTTYGTASANATFTLSASGITASNVTVALPSGFQVSSNPSSGFADSLILLPSSGNISSTTVYVRIPASTVVGTYSGNVEAKSANATSQFLALTSSTVNRATLTVTAENKAVNYADAVPELTYTITGFVNNENASVVTGTPTLSTTYTNTTSVAASPVAIQITQGTLSASNYQFSFVTGAINISCNTGVWIGTAGASWSNTANWCNATLPNSTTNVFVYPGNNSPVIATTANVNNITITTGATLMVTGTLAVAGTINNNGSIDVSAGTLELNGTSLQTLSSNFVSGTIKTLKINNTTGVNLAGALTITQFLEVHNGVFDLGNYSITLQSTAAKTAQVGAVTGTIAYSGTGRFVVERFLNSSRRGYRNFSSGGVVSDAYIFENWQEGGVNNNGYGTHITGLKGSAGVDAATGLDKTISGNPSLWTYSTADRFVAVTNTKTKRLFPFEGYFATIRGNRTYNMFSPSPDFNIASATLRVTGKLVTGNVVLSSNANPIYSTDGTQPESTFRLNGNATPNGKNYDDYGFSLIANPYPCAINWNSVYNNTGTTNQQLSPYYWVWNQAANGGLGAYVTTDGNGNTNSSHSGLNTQWIQPAQSFFVHNAGNAATVAIEFKESDKWTSDATKLNHVFEVGTEGTVAVQKLSIDLLKINQLDTTIADGAVALFANNYQSAVNFRDGGKYANPTENIAIAYRNQRLLSIEQRLLPQIADTIPLKLWNLTANTPYAISVHSDLFDTLLQPVILDLATGKELGKAAYFTADTTQLLGYANRFVVIFKQNQLLPIQSVSLRASLKQNQVLVQWKAVQESDYLQGYELQKSTDGAHFSKIAYIPATHISLANYQFVDAEAHASKQFYRLKLISNHAADAYSNTVVLSNSHTASCHWYPTVVTNAMGTLHMQAQPAGNYLLSLVAANGQVVYRQSIVHNGGTTTAVAIALPEGLAKGTYTIMLSGKESKVGQQQIIIQ